MSELPSTSVSHSSNIKRQYIEILIPNLEPKDVEDATLCAGLSQETSTQILNARGPIVLLERLNPRLVKKLVSAANCAVKEEIYAPSSVPHIEIENTEDEERLIGSVSIGEWQKLPQAAVSSFKEDSAIALGGVRVKLENDSMEKNVCPEKTTIFNSSKSEGEKRCENEIFLNTGIKKGLKKEGSQFFEKPDGYAGIGQFIGDQLGNDEAESIDSDSSCSLAEHSSKMIDPEPFEKVLYTLFGDGSSFFKDSLLIKSENTFDEKCSEKLLSDSGLEKCPTKLTKRRQRNKKITTPFRESPLICNQCQARFTIKSRLTRHMKFHSDQRPFPCHQCPARFKINSHLKDHLRSHLAEKPFACTQCSAQFSKKGNLRRHLMVSHSNARPFSCEECATQFKTEGDLKRHSTIHADAPLFPCKQCPAQFRQRSSLYRHLQKHIDERRFSCDQCSARFKSKREIKSHLWVHSDEQRFSCEHCTAQFKYKLDLKRHVLTHMD